MRLAAYFLLDLASLPRCCKRCKKRLLVIVERVYLALYAFL
jgi:hypothetical protein